MEFALISEFSQDHGSETIEQSLRDMMKEEGFGVLTEINVHDVLKEKLGIDKRPYKILGFCNPSKANKVLDVDGDIGLYLPCNGVIYDTGESIKVVLTNADSMFSMIDRKEIEPIANDVTRIFKKVKKQLEIKFS